MLVVHATALPAAEPGKGNENAPPPEQLAQYERGLALKAREAELEHQQKLRALELEGRRIEIDHQRRSFSTRHNGGGAVLLLDEIEGCFPGADKVRLEVEEKNAKAVAFYTAQGFSQVGRTANCGSDQSGIPAAIMEKVLSFPS